MIKPAKLYVITDMGVAHLLTKDQQCIEMAFAQSLLGTGELQEFQLLEDAQEFVESLRNEGSYWQVIDANNVPWDKPPIDDSEPLIDWPAIKNLVQQVLERAAHGSEKAFRKEAKSMGVSYEEFLAAAITEIVSAEIERQECDL